MPQVRLDYRTPYGVKDRRVLKDFYQQNKSGGVSLHFKVKIGTQANSPLVMLIKKQKDPSRHAGGSIDDLSRELNYKLVCFVKFFTLMYIHQAKDVYTHMHKYIQRYLRLRKIFIYLTIYAL